MVPKVILTKSKNGFYVVLQPKRPLTLTTLYHYIEIEISGCV